MKNIRVFLSENFQVLELKFSIYLNRRDRNGKMFFCEQFPFFYGFVSHKSIGVQKSKEEVTKVASLVIMSEIVDILPFIKVAATFIFLPTQS